MARFSKLIDTSRCTACRGCQTACKSWNQLPAEILEFKGFLQTHEDTSPDTFTYVEMKERYQGGPMEWFFLKRQCVHCTEAACEMVCPEKAIYHTKAGAVIRDENKCIGCDYCAQYCPFGIPKINKKENMMYKCSLCYERIDNNLQPACSKTCPTGAIQFGPREQMVITAQERLKAIRQIYPKANIYGLDEQFLEGLNVLYLLTETPEFYGLPSKPEIPAIARIWKDIIQPVGKLLPIGVLGAIFASTVMNRVMKNEHHQISSDEGKGGKADG